MKKIFVNVPHHLSFCLQVRLKLLDEKSNKKRSIAELEQTFQIIDTALLKCYLHVRFPTIRWYFLLLPVGSFINRYIFQTNDALVAPLIRLNNCNLLDSEKVLKKHKKYPELIILYETKGLHHKALELLQKLAEQSDSPAKEVEKMIQYLQRLGNYELFVSMKVALIVRLLYIKLFYF